MVQTLPCLEQSIMHLDGHSLGADPDLKPKLNNIIIQQLDDAAGDFSGLALKCLSPLVRKMNEPRVVEMCSQLCDKILSRTLGHCC
ncbi:unnamed protein product [Trifolium pratense]|uniref:Uncharacterized protein n=1 Tax=Trifolium pratense TaxID=57577 RepID=A0ACB0KKC7_TRIPR|nr:unnamed protein product [Trifolium pratense]